MKRIIRILVLSTLLNVVFVLTAFSDIINIPADYSTIQAGIDAATNGDTVLVQPGTYVDNINYNGKNITVGSLFLTTADTSYISQTVIDGDSLDSVVKFISGEDSTAVLCGFKITNGSTGYGGGINSSSSSPSLDNLQIIGNCAYHGGGIYLEYSLPSLEDLTIKDNNADGYGGGIGCVGSSPILQNVTIAGNSANGGGGIYCSGSSPSLNNVNITYNNGSGIYCTYNSSPSIVSSIVSDNTGYYGIYVNTGIPSITYSDFYNNENGNYYNCSPGTGCIEADPLFADPLNGDYHLSWANFPTPDSTKSPCIDAGDPSSPPDPDGTIADMGAYYFNQNVSVDYPQEISNYMLTNYPNPISSHINDLTVSFSIHKPGKVKIQLFNIKGQLVAMLINEDKNIGNYTISRSVNDLPSGIYFTKMSVDGVDREIRKVVLLR